MTDPDTVSQFEVLGVPLSDRSALHARLALQVRHFALIRRALHFSEKPVALRNALSENRQFPARHQTRVDDPAPARRKPRLGLAAGRFECVLHHLSNGLRAVNLGDVVDGRIPEFTTRTDDGARRFLRANVDGDFVAGDAHDTPDDPRPTALSEMHQRTDGLVTSPGAHLVTAHQSRAPRPSSVLGGREEILVHPRSPVQNVEVDVSDAGTLYRLPSGLRLAAKAALPDFAPGPSQAALAGGERVHRHVRRVVRVVNAGQDDMPPAMPVRRVRLDFLDCLTRPIAFYFRAPTSAVRARARVARLPGGSQPARGGAGRAASANVQPQPSDAKRQRIGTRPDAVGALGAVTFHKVFHHHGHIVHPVAKRHEPRWKHRVCVHVFRGRMCSTIGHAKLISFRVFPELSLVLN